MKSFLIVAALAMAAGVVLAAQDESGYVHDKFTGKLVRDKVIQSNGLGRCVRTGTWTREKAIPECDIIVKETEIQGPRDVKEGKGPLLQEEVVVQPFTPNDPPSGTVLKDETPVGTRTSQTFMYVFFDFDKSNLGTTEQKLLSALRVKDGDQVWVKAYTDRIGTDKYNAKLATRRATTVQKFLTAKNVTVFNVEGVGKSYNASCGKMTVKQLKACLRADRFAVIMVSHEYK